MKKKKNTSRSAGARALLYAMVAACLAGIGYSAHRIVGIQTEYRRGERLYAELRGQAGAGQPGTGQPGTAQPGTAQPDAGPAGGDAAPRPEAPLPHSDKDFAKLRERNGDTVAWVTIDGTKIDYPVVQGDDNDFYLDHLFSGARGISGSIFMDSANAPDFSDHNTLIFGHHMNDGSMFAGLDKYRSQKYYEAHPGMALYAPGGDRTVRWFAGYAIKAEPIPINFGSAGAFEDFVAEAVRRSDFKSDVRAVPGDRIVTLCTCSYVTDDARYLLMGVLE